MNYLFDSKISECNYKKYVECKDLINDYSKIIPEYPTRDMGNKGLNCYYKLIKLN
jgi:hypothetical protein